MDVSRGGPFHHITITQQMLLSGLSHSTHVVRDGHKLTETEKQHNQRSRKSEYTAYFNGAYMKIGEKCEFSLNLTDLTKGNFMSE